MKRLFHFVRRYKLFGIAIIGLLAGIILALLGQREALNWTLGTIAILETLPILWAMYNDLLAGVYGIDVLAITAIVSSVLLRQDWAAIVIVLMLTGGEALEDYAEHRAQSELVALLENAPLTAHILKSRKVLDVQASAVKAGDTIVIKPGELVPVDAIITEGTGSFDESNITGESLPSIKTIDSKIMSGTLNIDGVITAKSQATSRDSQYEQIIRLVQTASKSRAPFVRLADRYSIPFTLMAFSIAGAVWVISGQAIRFLEVIVVATPCPLLLAAPIALISGMNRASKHGIIVKTGGALERLAEAETIAFDKTGTLTKGELQVSKIISFQDKTETEILSIAASLEQSSDHVVAKSIVREAVHQNIKFKKLKHAIEIAGKGIRAEFKGQRIHVGQLSYMTENDISIPDTYKDSVPHMTTSYVAVGTSVIGAIMLTDEIRENAAATVRFMGTHGVKNMLMVTGDNATTAQYIAKQVGIQDVHAQMLPADKLRIIDSLKGRPVVFVGDGVNDAPVLTVADVGIALGAKGSAAASESADLVILMDDIGKVANAFSIAKRTFKIARQSILIGIGLSILLMFIFATGKFPPLEGAILQEGVDVLVIFNALRARRGALVV